VLDYKIKELKRDIGPREVSIKQLQDQTNLMQIEVKHFYRVGENLSLIVEDLVLRQKGLKCEIKDLGKICREQTHYMGKFKDDVFECLAHIADFNKLKRACVNLYKIYVLDEGVKNASDDSQV